MVLVKMSAQIIENRMFLDAYKQHLLIRFHSRPEFVSILGEGILTLTEDGRVLAANQSALFQLGVGREALLGRSVEEVFTESTSQLVALAASSGFHPVPIHGAADGRRFFGVVQLPQAAYPSVSRFAARAGTTRTVPQLPLTCIRPWRAWTAAIRPWRAICAGRRSW